MSKKARQATIITPLTTDTLKPKAAKADKIRKIVNRYIDETKSPSFEDFLEWLDCIK